MPLTESQFIMGKTQKNDYNNLRDMFRRLGFDVTKRALQSDNFVAGSAGWQINAEGNFEGNNGTFRGTLVATSGTIGGWTIGASTLTGGGVTLNSSGIITGGTIQTSSAINVNRIKIVGASNQIQFFSYDNTEVAQIKTFYDGDDEGCSITATGAALNTYYTGSSGASSIDMTASSAYVSAVGKSNLGNAQLGVIQDTNNTAYLALSWSGNNMATAAISPYKIVAGVETFLPWDGNFFPNAVALVDGITAPGTISGRAFIYVDTADGDLKVKFGDGTVKTIATDT